MINKKTLLAALLGACVALPLPVLAQDSSSDNDPVTLRVAYDADPVSLDIHEQLSGGILQLSHLVFDPLVRWTQDFEFEPRLATSWEQIDDTTLQMKLRKGVEFHSGNAFTAKDVAWTVERLKRSADFKAIFEPIDRVEVVDEHTVKFHTKKPYPLLLNLSTYIFPMDSEFYSGETADGKNKSAIVKNGNSFASRHVSGTGPYRVTERQQGVRVEFERFDNYWDEQSPGNVDRIVLTPISENATRVAALLSGDVDFIAPVPPNDLQRVRAAKDVKLVTMSGTRIIMLQMNQKRVDAFKNPKVRQAFAYAINQEAIADRLMKGFATPAAQLSPKGYAGHNPTLEPRYNLEKAKQLMKEAGYGDGFSITMMAPNNRYVNDAQIAQAVAAMLARINVTVDLKTLPKAQYWTEFDNRAADVMMIGWHADTEDSANFFQYLTECPNPDTGAGQYNAGNYCNPALDEKVAAANLETDREKRAKMLQAVEKALYDDAAFIPLHWQDLAWAADDNVQIEPVLNVMNFPYLGDVVVKPE
ncbi:peptide/nickel transport system substrate-binding protein [Chromohalobacter marismortui]|uniref:Peptide/nickel transport system substrate-binding protein n=3 Tax=Chromohalobacter TaxID=42054 RepID=A0A4V3F565_9GAMM|nr:MULTISPECIES: ABC transporter substrate-binding protein [Chromohalobacter]MCI0508939.1 ABC transporter substrate-binding protein [Chromohalobacter sp.]TDU22686.1 peptide/nickel transport system substrate-binding protein [Chromohalobacter marismortui]